MAVDDEATDAVDNSGEVDCRSASCTENDIGAAGIGTGWGGALIGANNEVGETVAIHITGAGDAAAAESAGTKAIDHEAAAGGAGGGSDGREVDGGRGGCAEHHITAAGPAGCAGCADDEVSKPVAVHIAGTGDADAAPVVKVLAIDHEAARAAGDGGEVDAGGVAKGGGGASATVIAGGIGVGTRSDGD